MPNFNHVIAQAYRGILLLALPLLASAQTMSGTATCAWTADLGQETIRFDCVQAVPCAPCPGPTPTPTPVPSPTPPPKDGTLAWVGVSPDLRRKGVSKETQAAGYYHTAFTIDTTPHAVMPNCEHRPGQRQCDQAEAEQDPRGSQLWMRAPVWGPGWEPVVRSSQNPYQWRHKPRKNEIGRTEFLACAFGESPGHWSCGGDGPGKPRVLDIR